FVDTFDQAGAPAYPHEVDRNAFVTATDILSNFKEQVKALAALNGATRTNDSCILWKAQFLAYITSRQDTRGRVGRNESVNNLDCRLLDPVVLNKILLNCC